jgi:hypothetical protein
MADEIMGTDKNRINYNPPGLSRLSYRIAEYPDFFKRMMNRIRKETIEDPSGAKLRPLAGLRAADKEDPSIALMDSWAMVLDVLTFYQERLANEGFLRTARERRSVVELGRAVGYELSPGMASRAFVAFVVDEAPGAPKRVDIPRGTKVMGIPRQKGSMPPIFETDHGFSARSDWNDIKMIPSKATPAEVSFSNASGGSNDAVATPSWGWGKDGIPSEEEILQTDDSGFDDETVKNQVRLFNAVVDEIPEPESPGEKSPGPIQERDPSDDPNTGALIAFHLFDGVNTGLRKGDLIMVKNDSDQWYVAKTREVEPVHEKDSTSARWIVPAKCRNMAKDSEIFAFRKRVSLFGHNAPDWNEFSNRQKLERMLGVKIHCAAFYGDQLFAGALGGEIFSNIGGPVWELFSEFATKTAVTSISSFRKPIPALNFILAHFVWRFSGILLLKDGKDFDHKGESQNDKLRIDLLKETWGMKIKGETTYKTMIKKRSFFFWPWTMQWLPKKDSRHFLWASMWTCKMHDLAWAFHKIIKKGTKPGSDFETLKGIVASYKNKCKWGKRLKEAFDEYEMNLGGGILAAGTAGDGVFFSKDGGETWEKNNQGLPNADIKSLAYDAGGNLFAKTKEDVFSFLHGDKKWETNKTVTVYDEKNYGGTKYTLAIGDYRHVGDDLKIEYIDSMKIGKGLKVTLIDYDSEQNIKRSEIFTEDTSSVGEMNNRIDEIKIEKMEANVQFNDDPGEIDKLLSGRLEKDWPGFLMDDGGIIDLEADYTDILADTWAVLTRDEETPALVRIKEVSTVSKRDFGISGKATRIRIEPDDTLSLSRFGLRDTVLYAASEKLDPASIVPSSEKGGGSRRAIIRIDKNELEKIKAEKKDDEKAGDILDSLAGLDGMEGGFDDVISRFSGMEDQMTEIFGPDVFQSEKWNSVVKKTSGLRVDSADLGLEPGQFLSVSGLGPDKKKRGEIVVIEDVVETREASSIILKEPISKVYLPETMVINANVAMAGHGETIREEILGSGDPSVSNQTFTLKRKPLTYTGLNENTLEIRVNGAAWTQAPSLYELDENSKNHIVRNDENGNTHVIFGDGKNGARLPGGIENVTATYRVGLGAWEAPDAHTLILPHNAPAGIIGSDNPEAAEGGVDPEPRYISSRRLPPGQAPHDRVVSLTDYENFAETFPGVAKAKSVSLHTIEGRFVHITVAGKDGARIAPESVLALKLREAIEKKGIFGASVLIQSYEPVFFGLEADIFPSGDCLPEDVEERVLAALFDAFSFKNRELGQDLTESEVIPVIQNVEGVGYAYLKGLSDQSGKSPGKTGPAKIFMLKTGKSDINLNMRVDEGLAQK